MRKRASLLLPVVLTAVVLHGQGREAASQGPSMLDGVQRLRAVLEGFDKTNAADVSLCKSWFNDVRPRVSVLSEVEALLRSLPSEATRIPELRSEHDRLGAAVQGLLRERDALRTEIASLRAQSAKLSRETQDETNRLSKLRESAESSRQELDALRSDGAKQAAGILGRDRFGIEGSSAAFLGAGLGAADDRAGAGADRIDCGAKKLVLTLFGYFEYEPEVSLKDGPRDVKLEFRPYSFPRTVPRYYEALRLAAAEEPIRIAASLDVDKSFKVEVTPQHQQSAFALDPTTPVWWRWRLAQPSFSPYKEAVGSINIALESGSDRINPRAPTVKLSLTSWGGLPDFASKHATVLLTVLGLGFVYLYRGFERTGAVVIRAILRTWEGTEKEQKEPASLQQPGNEKQSEPPWAGVREIRNGASKSWKWIAGSIAALGRRSSTKTGQGPPS